MWRGLSVSLKGFVFAFNIALARSKLEFGHNAQHRLNIHLQEKMPILSMHHNYTNLRCFHISTIPDSCFYDFKALSSGVVYQGISSLKICCSTLYTG